MPRRPSFASIRRPDRASLSTATFPRYLGAHPAAGRCRTWRSSPNWNGIWDVLALATEESPNVQYLHLDWALDELIGLYLTDIAPDDFALRQEDGLAGDSRPSRRAADESPHARSSPVESRRSRQESP